MAGVRPMYCGKDGVIGAFATLRGSVPYYSVWQGKDIMYQYNEVDTAKGEEMLETLIDAAEASGNTDIFVIKFHPKLDGGFITDKTKSIGSVPVRFVPLTQAQHNSQPVDRLNGFNDERVPLPIYKTLIQLESIKPMLDQKLLDLETRMQKIEAPVPAAELDVFDRIGSIIEKPGVIELIGRVVNMLPGIMKPQPNIQVAGVETNQSEMNNENDSALLTDEEDEQLNNALDRLAVHCDLINDLKLLADWADANTLMFKSLLASLKTEKK